MSPEQAIEILDRALDDEGQIIQLVRITGTTNQVRFSVDIRAWVKGYTSREIGGTILQGDSKVIISATDLNAHQWPGAQVNPIGDPRVPRFHDKVIVQGTERNVENSVPFYILETLVQVDLQVRGQK